MGFACGQRRASEASVLNNWRTGGHMLTNTESGGASPRGSLTADSTSCSYEHCIWAAVVVLAGPLQNDVRVCQFHWRELTHSAFGPLKPIRVLNRPDCFRPDCNDEAVAIMRNIDATAR